MSEGNELLEAVPNVSEGRRGEVVDALIRALDGRDGVALLDVTSDADHNRTVLTVAGRPAPLHAALLELYSRALERIDLRQHEGVHPRIGAVDVVPFVPLSGTPMAAAIAAAERLAAEVAERFDLPVYLYEEAARLPPRRDLAAIRRGGLENLRARLEADGWQPDFGPTTLHPSAGATVVGARFFLIAVNAQLATDDVELARGIARTVRESSGGLPAVKALGLSLAGRRCAQVSMNLVDYRRTSLATLLATVEGEAERRGTRVTSTEIVGLLPGEALYEAARRAFRLERLGDADVVERRLEASGLL